MKNALYGIHRRLDTVGERRVNLKKKTMETIQNETKRVKRLRNEQNHQQALGHIHIGYWTRM